MSTLDWNAALRAQLEFYWDAHLRPRLEGMTDEEYLWEPVEDSWSLREATDPTYRRPTSPPVPPLTTIAWRMAHVAIDVLGNRAGAFFGVRGRPQENSVGVGDGRLGDDVPMFDRRHWPEPPATTAAGAIEQLERSYTAWRDGIAGLDADGLAAPLGPKGGPFAGSPMADLILHISREVMHHGGEICLLRDLYRAYRLDAPDAGRAATSG